MDALKVAYGPDYLDLLKGQYRKGRPKGGLGKTIRQGVRIGLTQENAAAMAKHVGVVAEADLEAAAKQLQEQGKLEENLRNILGRFELAVDARIDAALALAKSQYVGYVRMLASAVAVGLALIAALFLQPDKAGFITAIIVGIAAIPLAPIAKDVAKGLRVAGEAIRTKK